MAYQITLIEAEIRGPLDGKMLLAVNYVGEQKATLEYSWDSEKFNAVFHGHAPSLPIPDHPINILQASIQTLNALKTDSHQLITDVFKDHQITITPNK